MNLEKFAALLKDYETNNVTALEGNIQVTLNEKLDLKRAFGELPAGDQAKANELLKSKGIDITKL